MVTNERYDAKTRTSTDLTAFPLRPSRDGAYLEARVTGVAFPAAMTAKIKIKPEAPEYRFDFTFAAVTKDPVPVPRTVRPLPAARHRPRARRNRTPRPSTPAADAAPSAVTGTRGNGNP